MCITSRLYMPVVILMRWEISFAFVPSVTTRSMPDL